MFRVASQVDRRQRYNVEAMVDNQSVHWALMHRFARDPEYVKAVIRSYVEVKKARGRMANEISLKLNYIEQELPQFADSFHAVRAEYRLPPSRVLPSPRILAGTSGRYLPTSSATSSRISQTTPPQATRRATEARRPATAARVEHQTLPPEFQVRPEPSAEDEAAPPPYARQDPEPDSTRMLQERLAAEAGATLPSDASPAPPPPNPASPPTLVWASPSLRDRRTSDTRPVSPPHTPEDEEIARAYEENQLEEAKRASVIAERERQEVAEAMRLSLADEPQAGPSRPTLPLLNMDDTLQRRMSSYSPATRLTPNFPSTHRRVVSSYNVQPDDATAHLSMPGGLSLLDADDLDGPYQAPMVPQKTGAVIQSRNPFLSHGEGISGPPETEQDLLDSGRNQPGSARTSLGFVGESTGLTSSDSPSRDQPGSSRTSIIPSVSTTRALPRIPRASTENIAPNPQPDPVVTDPLHTLSYYHTVFLIDDSPSITGPLWEEAKKVFAQVSETAMKYSTEGVDVHFTNSKRVGRELRSKDDVDELLAGLQARGGASIGRRLKAILNDHMERLSPPETTSHRREVKPMNLIVITDGVCAVPKDHDGTDDNLENAIIACAKELDREQHPSSQIGIQFLLLGRNHEAREALQQLDDGIAGVHGIRDMVDLVVHDEAEMSLERINKTLFGGIDRNWDDYVA